MIRFADFYIIELTMKCNTQCEYCYLRGDRSPFNDAEMDFETFKYIIAEIIENYVINGGNPNNRVTLVLHGGEPLLLGYNKLKQFIEYMCYKFAEYHIKLNASIQTNGSLLNQDFIKLLADNNISIGISYDIVNTNRFANENINSKIEQNIHYMNDNNISYGILSVINKTNVDKIFEYEQKLGKPIKLIPIYNVTNNKDLDLSLIEYFNKIEKPIIGDLNWLRNINTNINIHRIALKTIADILLDYIDRCQSTCNFKFCGRGIRIVAFEPDGSVSNCDRYDIRYFDKFKLADKYSYDFLGISQLKSALKFNYMLHNIQTEHHCDLCYARGICEFDCQALHYTKYKNFGIDSDHCNYTKAIYNFIFDRRYDIIEFCINNNIDIPIIEFDPIAVKYRYISVIKTLYNTSTVIEDNKIKFNKIKG